MTRLQFYASLFWSPAAPGDKKQFGVTWDRSGEDELSIIYQVQLQH